MPTYRLVESCSVATRVLVGFKMCFLNVLRLHVSQSQRQKRLYKQYMEQLAGAYVERYKGAELKPRWDQRYGYDAVPLPGDWRYSMSCGCDSETEGTRSCRSCCCSEWSESGHCSSNSEPCCSEVIFNGGQHFSGKIASQHGCQLPICYPGEFGDDKKSSGKTKKEVEYKCIRVIDVTDSEEELSLLLKTLKEKRQIAKTSESNALPPTEEVSDEKQSLNTNKDKNKAVEFSKNVKPEELNEKIKENHTRGPPPRPIAYNKITLDHHTNDGRAQSCSRKSIMKRSSDIESRSQRSENRRISLQESSGTERKRNDFRNRISRQSSSKEAKSRKARFRKKFSVQPMGSELENLQSGMGSYETTRKKLNMQDTEQKPQCQQSIASKFLKSSTEWKGTKRLKILSKSIRKSSTKKKLNHLPIEVKKFDSISVSTKSTKVEPYSTGSITSNRASVKSNWHSRASAKSMTPKSLSVHSKILSQPSTRFVTPSIPSVKPNVPKCLSIRSISPKSYSPDSITITTNGVSPDSKMLSRPSTRSMTLSPDSKALSRPSTGSMTPCSLTTGPNESNCQSAESMTANDTKNSKAGATTSPNSPCVDSQVVSRPSTGCMTPFSLDEESRTEPVTSNGRSMYSTMISQPSTRSLTPYSLSAESKAGIGTPNSLSADSKAKTITRNCHSGDSMVISCPLTRSITPYSVSPVSRTGTMTPNSLSAYSRMKSRSSTGSITPSSLSVESKAGKITPSDLSSASKVISRPSTGSATPYSQFAESNLLIRSSSSSGSVTPSRLSASSVVTTPTTDLKTLERLSGEPENIHKSISDSQLSYDSNTISAGSSFNELSDDSKTLLPLSSSDESDDAQWNSSSDETLTQQTSVNGTNTRPPDATPTRDYSDVDVKDDNVGSKEVKRKNVLRFSEYSEDSFATEVSTSIGLDSSDSEILVWKRAKDVEEEMNKERRELINKQVNRQMSERLHDRMYEQRYEREFDKKSKEIKDRIQQQITAQLNEKTAERKKDKHPFKNLSLKLQVFKPKSSKQNGSN